MSQLEIVETVVDTCSKAHLESLFAPLAELPNSSTKAEIISHCLNTELGAYGVKSYVSPDRTTVLMDDQGMCKIIDFFKGKGYQPVITKEHTERVSTVMKYAHSNNVNLLWAQSGGAKVYYYCKQYGFNGVHLYNILNINTVNTAAAALSPVGAATLSLTGAVALSWSGSLFLSTVENLIPNTMPRVKTVVSGTKFVIALPVRFTELSVNAMFGIGERVIAGRTLPTNTTEVFALQIGPKLKDLNELKKPVLSWLIKQLQRINGGS